MRLRKLVPLMAVAGVIAVLYVSARSEQGPKPVPDLSVLGYTNLTLKRSGSVFAAQVALVNKGDTTLSLSLSPFDGTPYPSIDAETPTGWTNYYMGGMTASYFLLAPGSNYFFFVFLPTNTMHWKMSFYTASASVRERALSNITKHRSWAPIFPLLSLPVSLLPNRAEGLEYKSPVFQVPSAHNLSVQPTGGSPLAQAAFRG